MTAIVLSSKVVGTVSIGLWAGYNLSLLHHPAGQSGLGAIIRSWFSQAKFFAYKHFGKTCCASNKCGKQEDDVKTKFSASQKRHDSYASAVLVLKNTAAALHASAISGVTFVSTMLAYSFANRSGKHPYLIYLSLGAPLVGILQFYGARELYGQVKPKVISQSEVGDNGEDTSDLSTSTYEHISSSESNSSAASHEDSENGEFSFEQKYSVYASVVAGLSSFLFTISAIGLVGESSYL